LQRDLDKQFAAQQQEQKVPSVRLRPVARWDFETDARDSVGGLRGKLHGDAKIEDDALHLRGGCLITAPLPQTLNEKSLEVLVQLDRLNQRGGGAMTVQTLGGGTFDSIVYAEQSPGEWLAGSNHFHRTLPFHGPKEEVADQEPVHLVMVYESDGTIRAYRNGKPYGKAIRKQALQSYQGKASQIAFGLRHGNGPTARRMLTGAIHHARLYDRALAPEEVAAAADGNPRPIVTRKQLLAELTAEQRQRLQQEESEIARLEQLLSERRAELNQRQQQYSVQGGGFFGVAHALLNSKEFIYVY